MAEVEHKKEISTGELVYKAISKMIWFGLAVGITIIFYRKSNEFFFETLKFSSNVWVYVSGLISFGAGTVYHLLYDGAFD